MCDFNKNAHYFVQLNSCTDFGFISMVSMGDSHWVECKLEPYEFDGFKYKLYTTPVDPDLRGVERHRCYYTCDFESMLKSGHIIKKTSESQHIEKIEWIEPLCGAAYVHWSAEVIVD